MSTFTLPVCIHVHDDYWFLEHVIERFSTCGPIHVVISKVAWDGSVGNWERSVEVAKACGADAIVGEWSSEHDHRVAALDFMRRQNYGPILIPDSDEIPDDNLLQSLQRIAETRVAERVRVTLETYWKSTEYIIRPREQFRPLLMVNVQSVAHDTLREYAGGRELLLGSDYGILHHLSYAGPDERIQRKVATWGHRDELVAGWFETVWKAWDYDKTRGQLHPTHPAAYGWAERIPVPQVLAGIDSTTRATEMNRPSNWPTISVVIPLYGGEDEIRLCLRSLESCADLLSEVIVVDDRSPDNAAAIVGGSPFATLHVNPENLGFAGTCNVGLDASSGDIVLFLNSDTVVPRIALLKLIESLMESTSVAAVGPCSNAAAYHQGVNTTYTSLETLDLFAEDFSKGAVTDDDVDILVGMCLAVRRSVLQEVGGFDQAFGIGFFEDNDLSYRMRRAGFRLKVARRSFIHHFGSRSMVRHDSSARMRLLANQAIFEGKWKSDLESGFASHLSGMGAAPIQFDHSRHPDRMARQLAKDVERAQISLCMIVRNEERVLDACLASAKPYFTQIVVVDTGSSDRTLEIARAHDVDLVQIEWPDSFAEARNASLSHAKGNWVFWMDADDTLPVTTGRQIVSAALNAPDSVGAFVVPVQFIDQGPNAGTRVDHVKLLRNHRSLHFEGRIHEQILGSVRELGWGIGRIDSPVLHSGYDTSDAGQKRKRQRDWHLLNLDLEERPDHPFVLFNCGMTAHFEGNHDQAIQWLRASIQKASGAESHLRKAFALMGMSYAAQGDHEAALSAFSEGLVAVGYDPELHFQRALVQSRLGHLEGSRDDYLAIQEEPPQFFSSYDVGIQAHKKWHNLAAVLLELGDYPGAKYWWTRALVVQPPAIPSAHAFLAAAMKFGDANGALQAIEAVRAFDPGSETLGALLCDYAKWLGSSEADILNREIQSAPPAVGCKLVLARHYLNSEQLEQARPLLIELADWGVAEAAFHLGMMHAAWGQHPEAIRWMECADALNPMHDQTRQQLSALKSAAH